MALNDARAKQAMFVTKKPAKSSMGFGAGRAIMWLIILILAAVGAIWLFFGLA
jgi:hypothetical protein